MRRPSPTGPVAVTGIATRTPAGRHADQLWAALLAAEGTLASAYETPDADAEGLGFACRLPATAIDSRDEQRLGKLGRRLDPVVRLGLLTALDALADACLPDHPQTGAAVAPDRCAVVAGSVFGASTSLESADRGTYFVPMAMQSSLPASISLSAGCAGPSLAVSAACATGAVAIGEGVRLIRDGIADIVIAGGAELLTGKSLAGIRASGALTSCRRPLRSARPFDVERDGTVAAEGAAFVILEDPGSAARRGARQYGWITGYATNCDAHHLTNPSPAGQGAARCMRAALADAGLDAADVVHVNAHATSTQVGDAAEARAIIDVFGARAVPVTANKAVTGHMMAASGAAEAIVCLLTLADRQAPPTANTTMLDESLEIDLVTGAPLPIPAGPVLSNSFGFGGHNAALLISPSLGTSEHT